MSTEILERVGQQIRFGVAASFVPAATGTNWTIGTPTDVLLTLAGIAAAAGRISDKADLGITRAASYALFGCVDFTGETPTADGTISYYWSPSTSGVAATGNMWGASGVDADSPFAGLGSITLAQFIKPCIDIGDLIIHDGTVVQNGYIGEFSPPTRYGQLIVVNNSDDTFEADDVEMHQVLIPIVNIDMHQRANPS